LLPQIKTVKNRNTRNPEIGDKFATVIYKMINEIDEIDDKQQDMIAEKFGLIHLKR